MTFSPIAYALHYGSGCRDCADEDGTCPTHGLPCNPKVFRAVVEHTLKAWTYGIEHGFMENPFSSPSKDDLTPEMIRAGEEAYWRKHRDMASPTPTEEPGIGPIGYAYLAMRAAA